MNLHALFAAASLVIGLGATSALAAPVASGVLDFTGDICDTGSGSCGNGSAILQTYGDLAGLLDVTFDGNDSAPGSQPALHWGTGYETLAHVGYANVGSSLTILFDPAPGFAITITGFDIAPYANRSRDTKIAVLDVVSGLLFSDVQAPLTTSGITSYTGPWTSSAGLSVVLGPDAWDIGISTIGYEIAPLSAPIPLPAGVWLLGGALAGLGAVRRRR